MIRSRKDFEASSRNQHRESAPRLQRNGAVLLSVNDQRRHLHLRRQAANVGVQKIGEEAGNRGAVARDVQELADDPLIDLVPFRIQKLGHHAAHDGRVPARAKQGQHSVPLLPRFRVYAEHATGCRSGKDQVGHTLRIPSSVGNRRGPAGRHGIDCESFQSQSLDDRIQVAHLGFQGEILDVAVRKTESSAVVTHEKMLSRVVADGTVAIVQRAPESLLEVRGPAEHEHQRRTGARGGIRDADAVLRGGETDFLLDRTTEQLGRGNGDPGKDRGTVLHVQPPSEHDGRHQADRSRCDPRPAAARRRRLVRRQSKHLHPLADVLERLRPQRPGADVRAVAHHLVDRVGDANPLRFRQRPDPRRHVHALADDLPLAPDDVAEVDADA